MQRLCKDLTSIQTSAKTRTIGLEFLVPKFPHLPTFASSMPTAGPLLRGCFSLPLPPPPQTEPLLTVYQTPFQDLVHVHVIMYKHMETDLEDKGLPAEK